MRLEALGPYLRRHRLKLLAGICTILISATIGLFAPLLVGAAVDTLQDEFTRRGLARYGLLLLVVVFAQGVFTFGQRMLLISMSRDIEFDLRNDYFGHLERMPLSFFQRSYTGDLMSRGTNDLQAVRMICGPAIMYSFNTLFTAAGALFFMSRIHLQLTLLALATMPLVAVATQVFGKRIHQLFEAVQEQFAELSTRVQENLSGLRVVRAYSQEEAEQRSFAEINREYVDRNRRLIWPMIAIGWVINIVQRGAASLARIRRVMDTPPDIRDQPPLVEPGEIEGRVSASDLGFAYEPGGEQVLRGIDIEVAGGETVALVGRTGSGKSTLMSLLPRLIDPPVGTLAVDDVDVRRLPLKRLRGAIAAVPQETFLFSATLRENISFGRPESSEEEIVSAARLAGLGDEVAGLPEGLDTRVGERGITLSGGQKQRVALARALLRRPAILLLDDCLSAVDTETEERILENLRGEIAQRTVFLVSHRISTVQGADQILVLDDGEIVERGDHRSLLQVDGIYADLHRRQQLERELAEV